MGRPNGNCRAPIWPRWPPLLHFLPLPAARSSVSFSRATLLDQHLRRYCPTILATGTGSCSSKVANRSFIAEEAESSRLTLLRICHWENIRSIAPFISLFSIPRPAAPPNQLTVEKIGHRCACWADLAVNQSTLVKFGAFHSDLGNRRQYGSRSPLRHPSPRWNPGQRWIAWVSETLRDHEPISQGFPA